MYSLDTVFRDIRKIISNITIKYESIAREHDTLKITKEFDKYKLALENKDSFLIYEFFDKEALTNAGIFGELLEECFLDKNNIPDFKRDNVLYYQRQITIRDYIEQNNYYRMLNGQPNLEEKEFIYIDIGVADELDIDYTIPIHLMSDDEISRLEHIGELDRLKTIYKDEYLHHIGSTKIDIIKARTAKNFDILYITDDINENLYIEFNKIYSQSRDYYMSIIFLAEFSKRYRYYDNFIAMMIMTMSIQRMLVNTFKYGIERDFYDLGSIKLLFESYSVPFIEELPISYQRLLMKNLNGLLRYKSSDKVLYDICNIMGFDNIDIYKYFLTKEHKRDVDGNPIFEYKEIIDEITGELKTVLDHEKMFDFKWISVDVKERSIPMALLEHTNKEDYKTVINNDPFWYDNDDLRNRLYESEFNYIESKYLKMNIMYNMTNVLFETLYFFRMLVDKKSQTSKITIKLPRIFRGKDVPIFNIVIMLVAMICRRNRFKGTIIDNTTKTMSIIGFNFESDLKEIRNFIRKNYLWVDQDIIKLLADMNMSTVGNINKIYGQIDSLYQYLIKAMRYSKTKESYHAHKTLFDSLMYCQYNTELFKKKDGTLALTYIDFLKDIDIDAYAYVSSLEDAELSDNIEHILNKLSEQITELKSSYYLSSDNNVILNALIKLIDFFKSYTTDLTSFNILYLFNNPAINSIRLISQITGIEKGDYLHSEYSKVIDDVKLMFKELNLSDLQIIRDWLKEKELMLYMNDDNILECDLKKEKHSNLDDVIYSPFADLISHIDCIYRLPSSNLKLRDKLFIKYETL